MKPTFGAIGTLPRRFVALLALFGRYVLANVRSDSQQETSDTATANSANKVLIMKNYLDFLSMY